LARRRFLINDQKAEELKAVLEEIARMQSGLIKGLDNRQV